MTRPRLALLVLLLAVAGGAVFFALRGGGTHAEERGALLPGEVEAQDAAAGTGELANAARDEATPATRREAAAKPKAKAPAAATAAAPPAAPQGPWLYGRVVGSDGLPVPDATVSVSVDGVGQAAGVLGFVAQRLAETAVTDGGGTFRVPRGLVYRGDAKVELVARGYLRASEVRPLEERSGDVDLGSFVLDRGVVLGGQVLSAAGEPVADAVVYRTDFDEPDGFEGMRRMARAFGGADQDETRTDEEGRFELAHERDGHYTLVVEHDAHPTGRFSGTTPTPGGELLTLALRLEPAAGIEGRILGFPQGRGDISVQYTDAGDDAAPVATFFASTFGAGNSANVAEDGTFRFEGLPVGKRFRIEAGLRNGIFGRTACSDAVVVDSGARDVELTWDPGARLQFRVVDARTNKGLSAGFVRYRWQSKGEGGMPDAQKRVDFESPDVVLAELRPPTENGSLELAIIVDGYLELRREDIEIGAHDTVDLGLLPLEPAPPLRVRVVEAASGKPVRNARVVLKPDAGEDAIPFFSLSSEGANGRTNGDGVCELPACSSETATLSVRKRGFAPFELEDVPMPRDTGREELVRLVDGGALEVRVVDENDQPVSKARVTLRGPDGQRTSYEADARGEVHARDLPAGKYDAMAQRPAGRRGGGMVIQMRGEDSEDSRWQDVVVTAGGEQALVLELPALATLTGLVTARGGPVAGAQVTLLEGEDGNEADGIEAEMRQRMRRFGNDEASVATTDAQGRYRLRDLPTGRHRLRVKHGPGAPAVLQPVELHEGANTADVVLPRSLVRGRVVDERGDAVAGASLTVRRVKVLEAAGDELEQAFMAMSFFGAGDPDGARSEFDGRYEILGVTAGEALVVEGRASGYVVGRSEPFELGADEEQKGCDLVLHRGGSVRVEVRGETQPFQPVYARRIGGPDGPPRRAMGFPRDGATVLRDLAAGTWRVSLQDGDEGDGATVEVRAGEESAAVLGA
ncbi:MAG: carboxypeptidase regulatory-like domain-containing protein [Planctomycetes bacterium]|nr:carboxypeptidase regulatory-like domain-containing protein [Planctomycetota bacterium]